MNKAKAIREYKAANPDQGPKAIAAALGDKNNKITPSYVSVILNLEKRKRGGSISVADLCAAKAFADGVGGIERAIRIMDGLAAIR